MISAFVIALVCNSLFAAGGDSLILRLRFAEFDPLQTTPVIPAALFADDENRLFIVQCKEAANDQNRQELLNRGAEILHFIPQHAYLVEIDHGNVSSIQALPAVRWIGPYHPVFRVDEALVPGLIGAPEAIASTIPVQRYNIQVARRGPQQKTLVANRIRALGATVNASIPDGFLLEATLSAEQLLAVLHWNEVVFVDRWGPPGLDMDVVHQATGGTYIELVAGYTGEGVRAEVMDGNLFGGHLDFQPHPPIFHGSHSGLADHGTSTFGINFGAGMGNPNARGMVPSAQGIFADLDHLMNRYTHTAELLAEPYNAVYQSNSWGGDWTTVYNTISAEIDDILLQHELLLVQSMSNQGDQLARPQAWAKNVVAVGGVFHQNTVIRTDDHWSFGASIGPASDGRIKPDLVHFYDQIFTTTGDGGYTQFCCTSAATPITAGHFGLFFEMWSDGVFENPAKGATVFENRPHMATAKAMLINSASSYTFSGTTHDLTRTHQGWGLADVKRLYDRRARMYIVDETDVLTHMQSTQHSVVVPTGETEFRATLVYTDPAGLPTASQHRVNDLTLRVISPLQVMYFGNNGLLTGNWSTPGGLPNDLDTVENVFVQNPQPGTWIVEVRADEINLDAHLETPEFDADYALVVSGAAAPVVAGDCDDDGDVELIDYQILPQCVTGPGFGPFGPGCECGDVDGDNDIDLDDLAIFQNGFACRVPALVIIPHGGPICPNETVTLLSQAQGNAPLQYQWLRDGAPINGATSATFTISAFDESDAGSYSVRVTNHCGVTMSPSAHLSPCVTLFYDDFEMDAGWTVINDPEMIRGHWARAVPTLTMDGTLIVQPGGDNAADPGSMCFITGPFGGTADSNDVDGGPTELFSPILDLTGHDQLRLRYAYWYYRDDNSGDDGLMVSVSTNGGSTWIPLYNHEDAANAWRIQSIDLDAVIVPTSTVQFRFAIADTLTDTTLEALIDSVEISVPN